MNHARFHSVVPLVVAAVLAVVARPASAIEFTPKEGSRIERTLELKGTRDLLSMVMKLGDETQEVPGANRHIELGWKHVVTDEFTKCSGDRVTALKRTYETLEKKRTEHAKDKEGADRERKIDEECALAGKTVRFAWNAEREEYDVTFDGEDTGDKESLEKLDADMDYRRFLPAADAEVGAKWELDFADVKGALLRPGGDLPFHGEKPPTSMDKRMRDEVWDAHAGRLTLELGAVVEEDGRKLQKILFQGQNTVAAATDAEEDEQGPSRLAIEDDQQVEGELVWDVAAGRAHSIAWSAKGEMKLTVSIPGENRDGDAITIDQVFTFDTEYAYTGTFTAQ